jgi:hypothetical protein
VGVVCRNEDEDVVDAMRKEEEWKALRRGRRKERELLSWPEVDVGGPPARGCDCGAGHSRQ